MSHLQPFLPPRTIRPGGPGTPPRLRLLRGLDTQQPVQALVLGSQLSFMAVRNTATCLFVNHRTVFKVMH